VEAVQQHPSGFRFPGVSRSSDADANRRRPSGWSRHRGEIIRGVARRPDQGRGGSPSARRSTSFSGSIAPASVSAIAYRTGGVAVLTVNSVDGDVAALIGKR
jgi:hypothetical protein